MPEARTKCHGMMEGGAIISPKGPKDADCGGDIRTSRRSRNGCMTYRGHSAVLEVWRSMVYSRKSRLLVEPRVQA